MRSFRCQRHRDCDTWPLEIFSRVAGHSSPYLHETWIWRVLESRYKLSEPMMVSLPTHICVASLGLIDLIDMSTSISTLNKSKHSKSPNGKNKQISTILWIDFFLDPVLKLYLWFVISMCELLAWSLIAIQTLNSSESHIWSIGRTWWLDHFSTAQPLLTSEIDNLDIEFKTIESLSENLFYLLELNNNDIYSPLCEVNPDANYLNELNKWNSLSTIVHIMFKNVGDHHFFSLCHINVRSMKANPTSFVICWRNIEFSFQSLE